MTPDRLRELLAKLGIGQTEAAAFLGVNPKTVRRWATGEQDVPDAAAMLLEVMAEKELAPEEVERIAFDVEEEPLE